MTPEEVRERVRAGGLLPADGPVVAMLSGGRDSVCLLDLAVSACGAQNVHALHVNYGLRPEAQEEERYCRQLCERLGAALEVVHAQRPARGAGNLQAWAREVRYWAAEDLARSLGAQIATGHTASDQAETVLYRLAASPGRRALLGMAPREGRLVRPLLALTREQTAAHCVARGLAWRDDSSNDSDRFARGRVRHRVLRGPRGVHPAAEQNLLRSVEILRAEAAVLDDVVDVALAGRARIALTRLAELPDALARLVVIRLAEDAAGEPVAAVGSRLGDLLELGRRGGSAALEVGGGVRAVVEYGVLRFTREQPAAAPHERSLELPGAVEFGSWALSATVEPAAGRLLADAGGTVGMLDEIGRAS